MLEADFTSSGAVVWLDDDNLLLPYEDGDLIRMHHRDEKDRQVIATTLDSAIGVLTWSADRRRLAVRTRDDVVVFDADLQEIRRWTVPEHHVAFTYRWRQRPIALSHDGRLLAVGCGGLVRVYDVGTGDVVEDFR
jgi:hypothetical protein